MLDTVKTTKLVLDKNERIAELEEENKKLNENVERYKKHYLADEEYLECQDSAIKKLKSDLAFKNTMLDNVKAEYESSQDVIKELEERIRFLEQCLDNKEKVNKQLREELGKFVMNNPS